MAPTAKPEEHEISTRFGTARAHVTRGGSAAAMLALGHGAGGGVGASDLVAARDAALALGLSVVLVEQPYRVAGRRSPAPPSQLDDAWLTVVVDLRSKLAGTTRLIVGGRSSGARVACRTAADAGAAAVLCLAFPLQPPRRPPRPPAPTRLPELDALSVPTLVVQGERDPFGVPPRATGRDVVVVPGDHSLRSARAEVVAAVDAWLRRLL